MIFSFQELKDKVFFDQKKFRDKKALSYMKDCVSVLDVGCGEGRFISHDPKRIVGIDQNEKSLSICKRNGYNVFKGNVTQLPFDDCQFDAVHCAHVIEHLFPKDAYKLLQEMSRVLKKGGILCLRAPMFYNGFYDNFTHIKPYPPYAVLHYLLDDGVQRTFDDMGYSFEKITLIFRRNQFFERSFHGYLKIFYYLSNILHRFGIAHPRRTGYMLILRKIH